MAPSIRIFLVDENNVLRRLPVARYERLLHNSPGESMPEYAGKRVKYALAIVDLRNRKPVDVVHIQFSYLFFNARGKIDQAEIEMAARLVAESLSPISDRPSRKGVIDATHRFAKKRFDHRYRWIPSRNMKSTILRAIMGK